MNPTTADVFWTAMLAIACLGSVLLILVVRQVQARRRHRQLTGEIARERLMQHAAAHDYSQSTTRL